MSIFPVAILALKLQIAMKKARISNARLLCSNFACLKAKIYNECAQLPDARLSCGFPPKSAQKVARWASFALHFRKIAIKEVNYVINFTNNAKKIIKSKLK